MSNSDTTYTRSGSERADMPTSDLKIKIPHIRENDKICIITDRKLNDKQITTLNEYYSVYEVSKDDTKKHISKLVRCDIYIIPLINNICRPESNWGSIYYARSRKWFVQSGYTIVYYRTLDLIHSPERLKADYIINEFPDRAVSRYDLYDNLCYNSVPRHMGCCGLLIQFFLSRITCADVCSLICGVGVGL